MGYRNTVLPIMRNLRPLLMEHWGKAEGIGQTGETIASIVTEIDIAVESQAKASLAEAFRDIEFVGEEGGGNRDAKRFWLMDPIDGTQHYVRGLPFCTSMLALIEDGSVTFSIIYDFINDQMFWAERGGGSFCGDIQLRVSNRPLNQAYIGWETHLDKSENMDIFNQLRKQSLLIKTVSSGWEHVMVASGKLDARVCFDPHGKDYDFAPGSLLVREAGGVIANIGSTEYNYRNTNFIAANPIIFKELTEGENAVFPIRR